MLPTLLAIAAIALGLFIALGLSVTPASAQRPDLDADQKAASTASADELLRLGLQLESESKWGEAIEHYESAHRRFSNDRTFYQRLLISRLHFDVNRRYRDETFLQSVRELTASQTLDLYTEILANLQTHYVDTLEWSRVLLHGTAALEVALTEPAFVNRVAATADPSRLETFRQEIHHRIGNRPTLSRFDLRATVSLVAKMANEELGIAGTATILEYVGGAVATLDPYTRLLSSGQLDEMFSTIRGNFVGLGVELKPQDDALQILSVIPGGPAAEAGITAGDRVLEVAGVSVSDRGATHVADLLRGPEGSVAVLRVAGMSGNFRMVKVARRRVEVPSVENAQIIDPAMGIGYFRITNFQETTPREVEQALWKLHREGMRTLVMDLRENPGGLLNAAVDVADRFITDGPIVTTRGRNPSENRAHMAHRPNTWDMPLVVLIDRNSASASEIFSGAIRDAKRGTVIGETSYGKGRVQGIFRMQSARFGLCLTTSEFYSPSGRAIDQIGVEPHIAVSKGYIMARPDHAGRVITPASDTTLQQAIAYLRNPNASVADAHRTDPRSYVNTTAR
ncbi:MAG: S41 family peptidase [Planctomycetota bacterium]